MSLIQVCTAQHEVCDVYPDVDCEQSLTFFAKLLKAKPKHASGEAVCREKRGRKPEKKK